MILRSALQWKLWFVKCPVSSKCFLLKYSLSTTQVIPTLSKNVRHTHLPLYYSKANC